MLQALAFFSSAASSNTKSAKSFGTSKSFFIVFVIEKYERK
jgi:hypothetical protein